VDAGLLYENMKSFNARPILAETYTTGGSPGSYKATVYIKADQCTPTTSMAILKGKRACSTGYRKTAGWRIPIGKMMASGAMPIVSDNCEAENDAESAAAFFSEMCAPNVVQKGGTGGDKDLKEKLCDACKDDCSSSDSYADYTGAFRGLAEDRCDVAFAKDTTLDDARDETWWGSNSENDFKVLCPMGGCIDYGQYDSFPECAWASTPSHATVINPMKVSVAVVADVQAIFAQANGDSQFQGLFFKTAGGVTVNTGDLVFKSSTMGLQPVKTDMRTYLGDLYEVYQELETVAGHACVGTDGTPQGPGSSSGGSSSDVPVWGIVLFVLIFVLLLGVSVLVFCMIRREKAGAPMFASL
jgi:melanoma-associated antigen p97